MAISSLSDVKRVIIRWGIVKATNATRMDIATEKRRLLRGRAAKLGIYEVSQQNGCLLLYQNSPDVTAVLKAADIMKGRILLNAGNKPYISVKLLNTQTPVNALKEALSTLEQTSSAK